MSRDEQGSEGAAGRSREAGDDMFAHLRWRTNTPGPRAGRRTIPGTREGGEFRLVRPLDDAGRVHDARHSRLPGRFVVKVIPGVDAAAFQRAAQTAHALRHPKLVRVIDFAVSTDGGSSDGFLVMDHLDGHPLAALLAEGVPMSARVVARIIDDVAEALAAAHGQGLAHGQVRPDRIFVSAATGGKSGGQADGAFAVKVTGLGLGGDLSGTPELRELTPYTAPEVDLTPRADQFSLAAVAFEMLTGQPPFDGADGPHEASPARWHNPAVPPTVEAVIRVALAIDPARRWPDVATFARRLEEAMVDARAVAAQPTADHATDRAITPISTPILDWQDGAVPEPVHSASSTTLVTARPAPSPGARRGRPLLLASTVLVLVICGAALGAGERLWPRLRDGLRALAASPPAAPMVETAPPAAHEPAGIQIVQLPSTAPVPPTLATSSAPQQAAPAKKAHREHGERGHAKARAEAAALFDTISDEEVAAEEASLAESPSASVDPAPPSPAAPPAPTSPTP